MPFSAADHAFLSAAISYGPATENMRFTLDRRKGFTANRTMPSLQSGAERSQAETTDG
jgi:hypothetical protein